MKTLLFGFYSNDENGALLGYRLTKEYVKAGNELQTVVCSEYNLTDTGFAENSYQLVAIGNDEKAVASFMEEIRIKFKTIIEKSFGEDFDKIDFDDNALQEEFRTLMVEMETKGEVKQLGNRMYQIKILEPIKVEVAVDINTRWEEGMEHDIRSREIYNFIEKYDFSFCGDALSLSAGGDGDNGEHLMYLLDEFFANKDKQN